MSLPKELQFICDKCHRAHIAEHGVKAAACAFQAFDNEYCPDVQLLVDIFKAGLDGRFAILPVQPNDKEKAELNLFFSDMESKRRCRVCGCTDDCACPEGCYWVEEDLCSECAKTLSNEQGDHYAVPYDKE